MPEITIENFLIGIEDLLYVATDICLSADALAEWIKGGCRRKPDNDRDFKKIAEEIAEFLDGRQVYCRKKIKAMAAVQGNKRLEQAFETATKILEPGASIKVKKFIAIVKDSLYAVTDLCRKADALVEWVKGGCKKKPNNNRKFEKIIEEIVKYLRGRQGYYVDLVEALESAQKSKKLKEDFETALKIIRE